MLQNLLKYLEKFVGQYSLPGGPDDIHLLPVSGGADSTALAVLMKFLFPEQKFVLFFSDTGADEPEIYNVLDKLEAYFAQKIVRVGDPRGLFGLIEEYGGFLPSAQARWCTRELKLVVFEKFVKTHLATAGRPVHAYIGIRADECSRVAFASPFIETELPFIDLGVVREDVFRILDLSIGIPGFYRTRSRSGCSTCMFQRKTEVVGLFFRQREEFVSKGIAYEKLSDDDQQRFEDNAVPLWKETGISQNHLGFPVPARIDVRTRTSTQAITWGKSRQRTGDLFGNVGLWVAVEFFVHPGVGGSGVWMQNLVSYSRTRHGLERQINLHWQHRLQTAEVLGLSQDQVRNELCYGLYYLELPENQIDLNPLNGGYTWQQGESYKQIRHVIGWIQRTLNLAAMQADLDSTATAHLLSAQFEAHEIYQKAMKRISAPTGTLLTMDRYDPKEPTIEDELDEKTIPCPLCHI